MDREPSWDLYRVFLAVAQQGSLSAAAREIGASQPTIGRQIEQLETSLGAKLFVRSQRGYVLSEAGRELVASAEVMASAAHTLQRLSTAASEDKGTVRITAGAQLGIGLLPAILTKLGRLHPGIAIELSIASESEDLSQRHADVAVRMARPSQKVLVARLVGRAKAGLFAHRDYVAAFGQPKSLAELTRHRLIGFDREWRRMRAPGAPVALHREDFVLRSDNVTAQIALVQAGAGIGVCDAYHASNAPDIVPVLPKAFSLEREVWLVTHPDVAKTRAVRTSFDYLAHALKTALRG